MKLAQVSSSHSRACLCSLNRLPKLPSSSSSFSPRKGVAFNPRPKPLSVCGFCRAGLRSKASGGGVCVSAIGNACCTEFGRVHHMAVEMVSLRKLRGKMFLRAFSTCTSKLVSTKFSLVMHSRSSLALVTRVALSDAPQRSEEWFAVRRNKLTTSTFSTALGFWKGNRRPKLWHEKVFDSQKEFAQAAKNAMQWGVVNEEVAIERYKSITGREVGTYGFASHGEERFDWIGASPDGLLDCFQGGGILEVKCPYNKGKPEQGLPWSMMPFYYMPQVQGQMEIMDRDWVDLYCWTPNGSTIFRVCRDRSYWDLMHGILREFWWENVIPAKEALLLGNEEKAREYMPTSTHKKTGLAIVKSLELARESKLLCRETAGHIEIY